MTEHVAQYLAAEGASPADYTLHKVRAYGTDDMEINGSTILVVYSALAGRGAINAGGDWDWMDALSAQEVAEKHYALGDSDISRLRRMMASGYQWIVRGPNGIEWDTPTVTRVEARDAKDTIVYSRGAASLERREAYSIESIEEEISLLTTEG